MKPSNPGSSELPRLEAGINATTVGLRVVGSYKKETRYLGINWATLLLGDIITGTWPSRFGESRILGSKILS
jgi:hypothetical protein